MTQHTGQCRHPSRRATAAAVAFLLPLTALAFSGLLAAKPPPPPPKWEPPPGLPRKGAVRGTLRTADGKPEQAVVRLRQYTRGSLEGEAKTDAQGDFVARGLPYGRYRLTVRGDLVGDVELTTTGPEVRVNLTAPPWATLRG